MADLTPIRLRLTSERVLWAKKHVMFSKMMGLDGDPLREWAADAIEDLETLVAEVVRLRRELEAR
jgi:hypothetical protein